MLVTKGSWHLFFLSFFRKMTYLPAGLADEVSAKPRASCQQCLTAGFSVRGHAWSYVSFPTSKATSAFSCGARRRALVLVGLRRDAGDRACAKWARCAFCARVGITVSLARACTPDGSTSVINCHWAKPIRVTLTFGDRPNGLALDTNVFATGDCGALS